MGWGAIRVWNDDEIGPNSGFPAHTHRDMVIITYVRSGAITHQDSMGTQGRTADGDVQAMSAGTGVCHSGSNLEGETTTSSDERRGGDGVVSEDTTRRGRGKKKKK